MKKNLYTAGAVVAALVALGCAEKALDSAAVAQGKQAPMFEVDPFWPKPLPNHWILGSTIGIGVDSRDHIYIIHRRDTFNERTEIGAATDPVKADCCIPAPNVLEFDQAGNGRHPITASPLITKTTCGLAATVAAIRIS
jgi:hypothetical protein